MKKIIIFIVAALSFIGCGNNKQRNIPQNGSSEISGDTTYIEKKSGNTSFTSLCVFDAANLHITIGPPCSVKITGQKCFVDAEKTDMANNSVTLKFQDHDTGYRRTTIYVTAPHLDDIEVTGCGLMTIEGVGINEESLFLELNNVAILCSKPPLQCDETYIKLNGMQEAEINLECNKLNLCAHNALSVKLTGTARQTNFDVRDNTNLNTDSLRIYNKK